MSKLNRWFVAAVLCGAGTALAAILFSHGAYFGWAELFTHGATLAALGATLALMVAGLAFCLSRRLRDWFARDFWALTGGLLFAFLGVFWLGDGHLQPTPQVVRGFFLPAGLYLELLLALGVGALVHFRRPFDSLRLERGLGLAFWGLLLSSILASLLIALGNSGHTLIQLSARFLMEQEQSVYTYASGIVLLGVGVLNWQAGWRWFGALFILLSVDELVSFHELIIGDLRLTGGNLTGSLFAYLVPLLLAFGLLVWLAWRRVRHLPRRQRWLFFGGLALLFGGAVILESISEVLEGMLGGENNWPLLLKKAMLMLEEGLELAGALALLLFSWRETRSP